MAAACLSLAPTDHDSNTTFGRQRPDSLLPETRQANKNGVTLLSRRSSKSSLYGKKLGAKVAFNSVQKALHINNFLVLRVSGFAFNIAGNNALANRFD